MTSYPEIPGVVMSGSDVVTYQRRQGEWVIVNEKYARLYRSSILNGNQPTLMMMHTGEKESIERVVRFMLRHHNRS